MCEIKMGWTNRDWGMHRVGAKNGDLEKNGKRIIVFSNGWGNDQKSMMGKGEEWEKNGHWIMATWKWKWGYAFGSWFVWSKLKSTDLLAYEVI